MATTTTTIENGNVYLTDGSVSGDTITTINEQVVVDVAVTQFEHNYNKELLEINLPIAPNSRTSKKPENWHIDLKRIKGIITIIGNLIDDTTSAFTKRRRLAYLQGLGGLDDTPYSNLDKRSGGITVVWGLATQPEANPVDRQQKFKGNIVKISMKEIPGQVTSASASPVSLDGNPETLTEEKQWDVQIQVSIGNDRFQT